MKQYLVCLQGGLSVVVTADDIGGGDGELALFRKEKIVALFAQGAWLSVVPVEVTS